MKRSTLSMRMISMFMVVILAQVMIVPLTKAKISSASVPNQALSPESLPELLAALDESINNIASFNSLTAKTSVLERVKVRSNTVQAVADHIRSVLIDTAQDLKQRGLSYAYERQQARIQKHDQTLAELNAKIQTFIQSARNDSGGMGDSSQAAHMFIQQLNTSMEITPLANPLPLQFNTDAYIEQPRGSTIQIQGRTHKSEPTGNVSPPQPEDLAETVDAPFTSEIRALASQLEYNPNAIYKYVRNSISFDPYYGSRKGALLTLWERSGNDIDTANLLTALLRVSGYPTRYVSGTIELDAKSAQNWVGNAPDLETTVKLLTNSGYDVRVVDDNHLALTYVWVEVFASPLHRIFLPSIMTTGSTNATATKYNERSVNTLPSQDIQWLPLAPSFKQFTFTAPLDVKSITKSNSAAWPNEVRAVASVDDALKIIREAPQVPSADRPEDKDADIPLATMKIDAADAALLNYINANPSMTNIDLLGGAQIIHEDSAVLPSQLPFPVLDDEAVSHFSSIGDSLHPKLSITVAQTSDKADVTYEASLVSLAAKRLTISYVAATPDDQAVINSYGGSLLTTPPVINLIPVIKVDGVEVGRGTAAAMGTPQIRRLTFTSARGNVTSAQNYLSVGDSISFEVDYGRTSAADVDAARQKLVLARAALPQDADGDPAANAPEIMDEAVVGPLLHTVLRSYFNQTDFIAELLARYRHIRWSRPLAGGVGLQRIIYTYSFNGMPLQTKGAGIGMDIQLNNFTTVSLDKKDSDILTWFRSVGAFGSALEHASFEWNGMRALSTIRLLNVALDRGVPVYRIDASNRTTVFPRLQLPTNILNTIKGFLDRGYIVTVHEHTLSIDDWTGVGYIVTDPTTGGFGYFISGGMANTLQHVAGGSITHLINQLSAIGWASYNVGKDLIGALEAAALWSIPEPTLLTKVAGAAVAVASLDSLGEDFSDLLDLSLGTKDPDDYIKDQLTTSIADKVLEKMGSKAIKAATDAIDPNQVKQIVNQVDNFTGGAASKLTDVGADAIDIVKTSFRDANEKAWDELKEMVGDKTREAMIDGAKDLLKNEDQAAHDKITLTGHVIYNAPAAPQVEQVQQDAAQRPDTSSGYDLQRANANQAKITTQAYLAATVGQFRPQTNVQYRPVTGFTPYGQPILGTVTSGTFEADFVVNSTIWVDAQDAPLIGKDIRIWNQVQKGQAAVAAGLITQYRIECAGPVDYNLIGWTYGSAPNVKITANLNDGFR